MKLKLVLKLVLVLELELELELELVLELALELTTATTATCCATCCAATGTVVVNRYCCVANPWCVIAVAVSCLWWRRSRRRVPLLRCLRAVS